MCDESMRHGGRLYYGDHVDVHLKHIRVHGIVLHVPEFEGDAWRFRQCDRNFKPLKENPIIHVQQYRHIELITKRDDKNNA